MTNREKWAGRLRPQMESLECRRVLSTIHPAIVDGEAAVHPAPHSSTGAGLPPAAVSGPSASFIDPTAAVRNARAITVGPRVYIGPFANVSALRGATVSIGASSNVQDNVSIRAAGRHGGVVIGDRAILAHNARVIGPATIGAPGGEAAFVGFNAVIDGATVEPGAMVSSLARVSPGIVIPAGMKVKPGMHIRTQAEAEQESLGKVASVTSGDVQFMKDVVHVNETFAAGYSEQASESPDSVRGVGPNPSSPPFNPISRTPSLAGTPTQAPGFRNRIIGDVRMANAPRQLNQVMGRGSSIRADEAAPFVVGSIARMADRVTVHGLEHSDLILGDRNAYGFHSVIHGGSDSRQTPEETTVIGDDVRVGAFAVVFRSTIGDGVRIGPYAYVDGSTLAPGTVVPRGAIIVNNEYLGRVEWI